MSMFQNPGYLQLARQFLATPPQPNSRLAGRFPDTLGFSRTPYGQGLLTSLMGRMRGRPQGGGVARGRPQTQYLMQQGGAPARRRQGQGGGSSTGVTASDFQVRRPTLSNTGRRR